MVNWIKSNVEGDKIIWVIALLLSIISLLSVYSATGSLAYQKMGGNTEYYLINHFPTCLTVFINKFACVCICVGLRVCVCGFCAMK